MYLVKGYIEGIEANAYTGDLLVARKYGGSSLLFKGKKAIIDSSNPILRGCEFIEIPLTEIQAIEFSREYGLYAIGRVGEDLFQLLFQDRLLFEADAQTMADYVNQMI